MLLQVNQRTELPKVDGYLDCTELQVQHAGGNKCCTHGGFNTKNISCSDLRKIACCNPNYLFTDDFK